jgi:hypothetical protein
MNDPSSTPNQRATDEQTPRRTRTRRRSKPLSSSKPCAREGCRGLITKSGGHTYCSFVCRAIARELERAQRVCEALGPDSPMVLELWTETVALSDAWSRHIALDRRLYREVMSVGITDEQWRAIKDGNQ